MPSRQSYFVLFMTLKVNYFVVTFCYVSHTIETTTPGVKILRENFVLKNSEQHAKKLSSFVLKTGSKNKPFLSLIFSTKIFRSVLVNFSVFPRNFFDCSQCKWILYLSKVEKQFFKKRYSKIRTIPSETE